MVEGLPPVSAAVIGYVHQCALSRDNGNIWCWGDNPAGELGLGDTKFRSEPTRIPQLSGAVSISAGVNNTCAIVESGATYCWGTDMPATDGMLIYKSLEPIELKRWMTFGHFAQVTNGRNFACAIRNSGRFESSGGGKITCWGSNVAGQLGSRSPRWQSPESVGQAGEVDGISKATDIDATYFSACAVENGKVSCWGGYVDFVLRLPNDPEGKLPNAVPGVSDATRVGIGSAFGCVVDNGQVLCWGEESIEGKELISGMKPDTPVPVPGLPK